ncbi:rho GTPase-activating protein 2 [Populus alba x Populus x berolinensis]|uniref:Rho GTPase-activating protein 2 n=1 Tax=Populus alba x Populus x berolinensis TaxID=444605 RepID=A0AAD6PZ18_9ROSI|nr:rho GTPase-activating protein 2 [Populus alba x Populus x berolinensis]
MTGLVMVTKGGGCGGGVGGKGTKGTKRSELQDHQEQVQNQQLSMMAFVLTAIRKSLVACRIEDGGDDVIPTSSTLHHMDIGWPTNVQHITHVTFDRFNGFLGLPVEFEVEIPCRVPSASASVFGVSAESMQCSYDSKGNSVPTILLLMQDRLYSQGGLKAEGIFRINPENSQEEHVRDQLNRGIVPDDIDVHCLAGLIKAWFRELPSGVLDGLSPEQVLQCNTEEESVELVKQLKPTEAALLSWAVGLMADVVEEEDSNKMNARNIAMVFSPNMTQMSDPLTALMHAVQVMNLLKTLITKTLRDREETSGGEYSPMSSHSSGHQTETDEEFDSQHDMETSCELRQAPLDYDDHAHFSTGSDEEADDDDIESSSEVEESFLRQLDEDKNSTDMFVEQPASFSGSKMESGLSFTDSKNENSSSASSDGEDSRAGVITVGQKIDIRSQSKGWKDTEDDKQTIDKSSGCSESV